MNMTFIEMLVQLLAGEAVRRNDWTPDTLHFIKLFQLPNSYNRSDVLVEYKNGQWDIYKFGSEDILYDHWKVVT